MSARQRRTPATLIRVTDDPDAVDDYGKPLEVAAEESILVAVFPNRGAANGSSENIDRGDLQRTTRYVILGPCLNVAGRDRIRIDGVEYQFDGAPQEWIHPRTREHKFAEADVWTAS